jgi:uncharacterized Zn finger protein (UPF0148 family)
MTVLIGQSVSSYSAGNICLRIIRRLKMLAVKCDFCGIVIDEYDINDDYKLASYKAAGRICCEACNTKWEEYEKEIQKAESEATRSLEQKKEAIDRLFFDKIRAKRSPDQVGPEGLSDKESVGSAPGPTKTFKTRLR